MNRRVILPVRAGDTVEVIAGRNKGRKGKVLQAQPKQGRVLVEGVNLVKKAVRPSENNPEGGIVEREFPLPVSNVRVVEKAVGKEAK